MPALVRGAVYRLDIPSKDPARPGVIPKWVVVLQGGHYWRNWPSVLFAVATSQPPVAEFPHFVRVPPGAPGGFAVTSWVDCDDLYRLSRTMFTPTSCQGQLDGDALAKVDDALTIGTGILDGDIYLKT
jgi:hypothetical protein